jgi:hypothetical protein
MGYGSFFGGVDPVSKLSERAQEIVKKKRCTVRYKDAEEIHGMTQAARDRLSRVVERDLGHSMQRCIEDASNVPVTTEAVRFSAVATKADEHASKIDAAYDFDLEESLSEFAISHGATKTEDYREVRDSWTEARRAWIAFRNKCRAISQRW